MTKQVTLENTLLGGFGLPTGQIVPGAGSIVVEPEIWDAAKDHPVVKARVDAGTLIVDGKGKKSADASADVTVLQARVTELESLLKTATDEITTLKRGGTAVEIKAEHHGGGKFNITQGETVLAAGLSKADADAFNAMSEADKAEFVKAKGEQK